MPSAEELARRDVEVPEKPWDIFIRDWRIKRGEHVTIIGPNGTGKTTLALLLLSKTHHVTMFATKKTDPFYRWLMGRGWSRVTRFPRSYQEDRRGRIRFLLWIPTNKPAQVPATRVRLQEALDRISDEGDMAVLVDELMFASSPKWLDLGAHLELGWQQWRTSKISIVALAQRASNVPLLAYDQVVHLFVAKENDLVNADRIGEMAALDRFLVRDLVRKLEPFQWLHIETRVGAERTLELLRPPSILTGR